MNTLPAMTFERHTPILLFAVLLLSGCAGTMNAVQHEDDVYFMPSQAPPAASAGMDQKANAPSAEVTPVPSDDYYDEGTSKRLGTDRSYYDMAYNDPYYYNYGRFGFGSGWQSGWNGPGWGMGYGWGNPGYGWNGPWGYGNSWGWNQPYGWGGDYWGYGSYNGWGYGGYNGWGWNNYGGYYGNYWSPMGPCHSCYTPIIVGGSSYVGHRLPLNRSSGGSGAFVPRGVRDPVSLAHPIQRQQGLRPVSDPKSPLDGPDSRERVIQPRAREARPDAPSRERKPAFEPARDRQPERNRDFHSPLERNSPSPLPRDGGGSSPSRHRSR